MYYKITPPPDKLVACINKGGVRTLSFLSGKEVISLNDKPVVDQKDDKNADWQMDVVEFDNAGCLVNGN